MTEVQPTRRGFLDVLGKLLTSLKKETEKHRLRYIEQTFGLYGRR